MKANYGESMMNKLAKNIYVYLMFLVLRFGWGIHALYRSKLLKNLV